MTAAQEHILMGTHGDVKEIKGILRGANGGGIIGEFEEMKEDMKQIKTDMVMKSDCHGFSKQRRNRWLAIKDVVIIAFIIATFLTKMFGLW